MPSDKPARRFRDIVENAEAAERYVEGLDARTFAADAKTRDAVERCLERIAEAAVKLGDLAAGFAPDQPWPRIRALGNRLRHEYDRVEAGQIWTIVVRDLPSLRAACEGALRELEAGG